MTAGELIRKVRTANSLTQAQLAARAQTCQPAISRIEQNHISPTVGTIEHLLRTMGYELTFGIKRV